MWRLTVRDLSEYAEGFHWRERQAHVRDAWLASVLLHGWVKDAPSPADLLGENRMEPTEAEAAMEQLTGGNGNTVALDAAYQKQAELRAHGRR